MSGVSQIISSVALKWRRCLRSSFEYGPHGVGVSSHPRGRPSLCRCLSGHLSSMALLVSVSQVILERGPHSVGLFSHLSSVALMVSVSLRSSLEHDPQIGRFMICCGVDKIVVCISCQRNQAPIIRVASLKSSLECGPQIGRFVVRFA